MSLNRQTQAAPAAVLAFFFTLCAGSTFASTLSYVVNSSKKVQQVDGPCDWASWDPKTTYGTPGPCGQTAGQAFPNQILGHGLGYSFEDTATGNLIVLFGDTIGVQSGVTLSPNPSSNQFLQFHAKDTIAKSSTATAEEAFSVDFYTQPGHAPAPLFLTSGDRSQDLPPQPDGTPVAMGAFDIPNSGISINGQTYVVVQTGVVNTPTGANYDGAYSVLVSFDGVSTFSSGRTISRCRYLVSHPPSDLIQIIPGHFVFNALYELPLSSAQQLGLTEPAVLIFGNGQFRQSSLYLSYIPVSEFWSGVDANGKNATRYFTGYRKDGITPNWSSSEADAVPVVWDNPPKGLPGSPDPGTIGNTSVTYDSNTKLWLMTYDGGRQLDPATGKPDESTTGIYFTYATQPWGPWQTPQLIYNACQAHSYGQGYGDFIFYYTHNVSDPTGNNCPSALPAGLPAHKPGSAGPAGPIIGTGLDPFGQDAFSTRGGVFAPEIIGRFTQVQGNTLKLYYNLSTWNPYTVVEMEAEFTIE